MDLKIIHDFTFQYMESEGKWYDLRWQYINACIMESYLDLYGVTGETRYLDFVEDYVERLFDGRDTPGGLDLNHYNIDQIKMAKVLLDLYAYSPKEKYLDTIHKVFRQLGSYPRTKEGNFWHKENYPDQVWLDGLYMGQPFYAEYIRSFLGNKDYSDTLNQFRICRKRIFDETAKLYRHGYDESGKMSWADGERGFSPCVWLRAVGWFAMALVDITEIMEEDEEGRLFLKDLLIEMIGGLEPHRHESGLWHQIPDRGGEENNYLETSGSAMIAYALLKGYRLGMLSRNKGISGYETLQGLVETWVREEDGEILLGGICRSAGLGVNPERGHMRDGTYEYYTTAERICENNGHGVAPLFMAYAEYLSLKKEGKL